MVVRLLAPNAMCLVRSLAFCAYLRAAGLSAQLMVGRERFCLSEDDAFHAWVELAGRVVNDHDEVQTGYALLHRVPEHEDVLHVTKPAKS
jgi:Transglutaminase-like superfamily